MSPRPARRKPPEKPVNNRKAIKNILSLLNDYKLKLTVTVICAILSTVFSIISPYLIGLATTAIFDGINRIMNHTGGIDFSTLIYLLTLVMVLYIISAIFSYLQSYFLVEISTKISYNLRKRLIDKVTMLPMESFDTNKRGDILSRITNDVDSLQNGITQAFLQMLTAVITIIGVFIMMLSINLWMTLATIVLVPISFVMILVVTK